MRVLALVACLGLMACTGQPHSQGMGINGCNVIDPETGTALPTFHGLAGPCPPRMTYAEVRKLYKGSGTAPPESCPYAQGSATCRQWESDKATINNRELATEYHKADQNHVCNSYNSSGCLPQAQKDAIAAHVQQNRDAITCYYGDQSACQHYPGGAAAATAQSQQMLWDSCVSSYRGIQGSDYYGTAHLACNFVH